MRKKIYRMLVAITGSSNTAFIFAMVNTIALLYFIVKNIPTILLFPLAPVLLPIALIIVNFIIIQAILYKLWEFSTSYCNLW